MPSKLTVYVSDSVRQFLNEAAGGESISKLVNDALESYMAATFVRDLEPPGQKIRTNFPSLAEVERRRPKVEGSSAEIIANQRRGRNARLSR